MDNNTAREDSFCRGAGGGGRWEEGALGEEEGFTRGFVRVKRAFEVKHKLFRLHARGLGGKHNPFAFRRR